MIAKLFICKILVLIDFLNSQSLEVFFYLKMFILNRKNLPEFIIINA